MGRRTPRRLLVAVATTALLTAACTGGDDGTTESSDDAAAPTGGSFTTGIGEPSFLAPMSDCYESECVQVINQVWTGLLKIDPETSQQSLTIAESIDSPNGKVWTVKLNDGYTFHNGEPVDAESFVRSWNYSAANATETGFFFSPVEGYDDTQGENPKSQEMSGLKVVDDMTIEINLSEPFSQWPLVMSYTPAFAPMAQACLADIAKCNEKPIGNGPYQMAGPWKHNDNITIQRYEDYTGDLPANADEIVLNIYGELATEFRDWQAGNLDISRADPTQYPAAEAAAGDRLVEVDSGQFSYFGFPLYVPEFQDIRIRQAMSLAIDRETINEKVYGGNYSVATDVIAPFVPGSRDDACEFCAYDPERAAQLYEEAGGIPGDKITIWFNNDGGHEALVQALGNGWRNDLGLDYEVESQPFTPYLATLGEFEVDGPWRLSWGPDYPSPENYLDPVYGEGSTNYAKWEGPAHDEFLDLVAQGDAAATVEEGIPAYQEAADVVLRELPVMPLFFTQSFIVYSETVDSVNYSPLDGVLLGEVTVN